MSRLLVHVEGPTEETFVNELLAPHLVARGYSSVSARILGTARQRGRRGGIVGWPNARREIVNHLKADGGAVATTMVDYYALPQSGPNAWPGRSTPRSLNQEYKVTAVHSPLLADVASALGVGPDTNRFVPFVVMHESEGLLFSDCEAFGRGIGRPDLISEFTRIRSQFSTPEEINDSATTAPSKRVEALIPSYEKPLLGTLAALEIGLPAMQSECPSFRGWLARLEQSVANHAPYSDPEHDDKLTA